jgi:uncharacterized membrane protein
MAVRKQPERQAKHSTEKKEIGVVAETDAMAEHLIVARQVGFEGPIPHPDIFKKYGEIIPDAPERILRVFEEDSAHSRAVGKAALEAQVADNRRLHWMAYSLVLLCFVLAGVLAMNDKDLLAGIILGTTLIGIVTGFLQSHKQEKPTEQTPPG